MSLAGYTVSMAADNEVLTFNAHLSSILAARRDELGMSLRQVEEKSGVNYMTVKRVLEHTRDMRMDDFEAIAVALGLTPWRVVKQAEEAVRNSATHYTAATIDPATYAKQAEAKINQLLQNNYTAAAKHHTPDPYANLGEENQEPAT